MLLRHGKGVMDCLNADACRQIVGCNMRVGSLRLRRGNDSSIRAECALHLIGCNDRGVRNLGGLCCCQRLRDRRRHPLRRWLAGRGYRLSNGSRKLRRGCTSLRGVVAHGLRSTIAVAIIAGQGGYKTVQSEYGEDRYFDYGMHLAVKL